MREVVTTPRFERRLVRFVQQHPNFKSTVRTIMHSIASENPATRIHALHGQMRGIYAARISQEYRLVFTLEPNAVIFIDIGSHDEVY